MRSLISGLQRVGQAFMLPVAVLPLAGLLLGFGAAKLFFIPASISSIMDAAGSSIFGILPLLFAIAIAIAFTKQEGASAIAALVGYVVFLATMGAVAKVAGFETTSSFGITTINTGVLGGIIVGTVAAISYNRYSNVQLPEFLAFFGGRRFVPIFTGIVCLILGALMVFVWQPVGAGIKIFSEWAAYGNPKVAFPLYGFIERLLIPAGLQHIWNVPFFFEIGSYVNPATGVTVHGDIARYLAGDKTAGNLAGSYLPKMWGLPAAAIAMIHTAKPENRKAVASLMISAALTSFVTGITEPIEFSFLFVAPMLYGIHAILVGLAYVVVMQLGIHHGMTFSQGLIDYVVLYANTTKGWMLIPLGMVWAVLYYVIFRFTIQYFNLKTPGREDAVLNTLNATNKAAASNNPASLSSSTVAINSKDADMGRKLVVAYGGKGNISGLDSCITRLRVEVIEPTKVNQQELKNLGAKGIVATGKSVHSIFGPRSDSLRMSMKSYMESN
ncbi:PTS glucose transporter subunit IIBC [Candidatus Hepatincolaceae symbiont of Richtersius coronifer]